MVFKFFPDRTSAIVFTERLSSYDAISMKSENHIGWIVLVALGALCIFLLPRPVVDLWVAESLTEARLGELGAPGLAPRGPGVEPGLLGEIAEANGISVPVEPEGGSQLLDVDCDGDLDFFSLGVPAARRKAGRAAEPGRGDERSLELYLNDGAGRFREVGDRMGIDFSTPRRSVDSECLDLDRDGRLDLVVFLADGSRLALWNRLGRRSYLRVVLEPAPGAEGAARRTIRVEATAGGRRQVRLAALEGGRAAARSAQVHFGFGEETEVEKLVVFWRPDRISEIRDVAANGEVNVPE